MRQNGSQTAAERAAHLKARRIDAQLVELAERGLALLDANLPADPPAAIARIDLVSQQALVQGRNAMHAAWSLLFDGFEVQALALARLITEYVVLSWYVRSGLGDPEMWLQTDARPPSTGHQLRAMESEQVPLPELAGYATLGRPLLHRLAHQDPIAFSFAYRLEDGRPSFFRRAGDLDAMSLRRGGEFLLPLMLMLIETAMEDPTDARTSLERDFDEWWDKEP